MKGDSKISPFCVIYGIMKKPIRPEIEKPKQKINFKKELGDCINNTSDDISLLELIKSTGIPLEEWRVTGAPGYYTDSIFVYCEKTIINENYEKELEHYNKVMTDYKDSLNQYKEQSKKIKESSKKEFEIYNKKLNDIEKMFGSKSKTND